MTGCKHCGLLPPGHHKRCDRVAIQALELKKLRVELAREFLSKVLPVCVDSHGILDFDSMKKNPRALTDLADAFLESANMEPKLSIDNHIRDGVYR